MEGGAALVAELEFGRLRRHGRTRQLGLLREGADALMVVENRRVVLGRERRRPTEVLDRLLERVDGVCVRPDSS